MKFNSHYTLRSQHAFLSPSNHSWLGYTEEKLRDAFEKRQAVARGTALHALAKRLIELGVKLPVTKQSLNQFVNDAIGYRMTPEQILFYSVNAFGTTDAISFRNKLLRIHDLKTGISRVHMDQLIIYAGLFCLEYEIAPNDIDIELRIYQSSKIVVYVPSPIEVKQVMEKIKYFDKLLLSYNSDELLLIEDTLIDDEE